MSEGESLARSLGDHQACILQNHGLLTVGDCVEAAAWRFVTMERSCQAQLLAETAGTPKLIEHDVAIETRESIGNALACWFSFKLLFQSIAADQSDMFE